MRVSSGIICSDKQDFLKYLSCMFITHMTAASGHLFMSSIKTFGFWMTYLIQQPIPVKWMGFRFDSCGCYNRLACLGGLTCVSVLTSWHGVSFPLKSLAASVGMAGTSLPSLSSGVTVVKYIRLISLLTWQIQSRFQKYLYLHLGSLFLHN